MARISLLSQDWLKFSSYKERLLGLSVGLISTQHHDLDYNLTWRTLSDPSHTSSKSVRRQLGHSLLSSVKYTYKVDRRDSHLRPTRGYAFASMSQIGGLGPDSRSLRFVRQVLYSLPLLIYVHSFGIISPMELLFLVFYFIQFPLSYQIFYYYASYILVFQLRCKQWILLFCFTVWMICWALLG